MGDEAVLRGDTGYWQHWWTMLHDASTRDSGRLTMDMIVPEGIAFSERSWHAEIDRGIRDYALTDIGVSGRIIVPPEAIGSPAEPLIEMGIDRGVAVRVLPSPSRFVIYNGVAAVLTDLDEAPPSIPRNGDEPGSRDLHSLTRQSAVIDALSQLFELQWSMALDWRHRAGESRRLLELLAEGRTDESIAAELGLSARTVSRRVSELMHRTGSASRFALGVHVGRAGMR